MDQVSHEDGGSLWTPWFGQGGSRDVHLPQLISTPLLLLTELCYSSIPFLRAQLSSMVLPCFCLSDL